MSSFFADYLDRLSTLHNDLITVLERLPQAALDWKPGPNMNSIAVLVAHSAGAETFWIGDMTVRGSSERVRAAEFQVGGLDHATLKKLLEEALAAAQRTVAQLTVAHLSEERRSPNHDQSFTVG